MNKLDYKKIKSIKDSVVYDTIYESSTSPKVNAKLGTLESDASGDDKFKRTV